MNERAAIPLRPAQDRARTEEVLEAFCRLLLAPPEELPRTLDALATLYHPDMVFEDPIQRLHGRDAFLRMNEKLFRDFREVQFDLLDRVAGHDSAYVEWFMELVPRRGPTFQVEGVTQLRLRDGLIASHRDYWDLLTAFADVVPVGGPLLRAALARLA